MRDYLLNLDHRHGRGKALFFLGHGFTLEKVEELTAVLIQHARTHPFRTQITPYGTKFVGEGVITSPTGKTPHVVTVLLRPHGSEDISFVTSYPA